MTENKLYDTVCCMVKEYGVATNTEEIAFDVIKNPHNYENVHSEFFRSAAGAMIEFLGRIDKNDLKSGKVRAIMRILNRNPTGYTPVESNGIFECNGRYIATDGCIAVSLIQDIKSLPHTESEFNFEKAAAVLNKSGEIHNIPTTEYIRAYIASEKADGRGRKSNEFRPIKIDDFAYVNPKYLLDMLIALPGAVAYKQNNPNTPIYFSDGNGNEGILCPCRSYEEIEKERIEKSEKEKAERIKVEARKNKLEQEMNAIANRKLSDAENILIKGEGVIMSEPLEYFQGFSNVRSVDIITRLAEKYGVYIPIKIKGWIRNNLISVTIRGGEVDGYTNRKSRTGSGRSNTFIKYMNEIIKAARDRANCYNEECKECDEGQEIPLF